MKKGKMIDYLSICNALKIHKDQYLLVNYAKIKLIQSLRLYNLLFMGKNVFTLKSVSIDKYTMNDFHSNLLLSVIQIFLTVFLMVT